MSVVNLGNSSDRGTSGQKEIAKLCNLLAITALLFGIFVRVVQYVSNRSLWGDEAHLVLNIVNRSYAELLQPLDYFQSAPPLFLWIEKLSIQTFGNTEYALRLFPLIAGIVSLLAIYQLGKWSVSAIALPIAVMLFACLKFPLYYATEVKQYSSDVMVALLLCLLLIPLYHHILPKRRVLLVGLLGAIAIWLSHPAIFTLAGLEFTHLVTAPKDKRKAVFINRLPVYGLWLISFAALYWLTISRVMQNQVLVGAWDHVYPKSAFHIIWLLDSLGRFFYRPLTFQNKTDAIAIVAFLVGSFAFVKTKRFKFLILMSPVAATLVASYLHRYPFRGRLVLFLTPFFIYVIAEGIAFLLAKFNQPRKYAAIAGVILACILILPSAVRAGSLIVQPETKHEIRPVMAYIKTHQQPNDLISVGVGATINQFRYYADRFDFSEQDYVFGFNDLLNPQTFSEQNWENYRRQLSPLQSDRRVWFLFSGIPESMQVTAETNLDRIGQKLDFFSQPGSFTYLYQLK